MVGLCRMSHVAQVSFLVRILSELSVVCSVLSSLGTSTNMIPKKVPGSRYYCPQLLPMENPKVESSHAVPCYAVPCSGNEAMIIIGQCEPHTSVSPFISQISACILSVLASCQLRDKVHNSMYKQQTSF